MSIQDVRLKKYRRYLQNAKTLEKEGDREEALKNYRQAIKKLGQVVREETNRSVKKKRLEAYRQLENKAENLEKALTSASRRKGQRRTHEAPRMGDHGEYGGEDDETDEDVDDFDQREFDALINGCIEKSHISWGDISGLDETKQIIKESIVLALAQKKGDLKVEGWSNILLYGPPGTGKTLLAAATSSGLGATFFNVKISDVLSRYVGDSPKILATLFRRAQEEAPSVIFIDEIENLVESRDSGKQSSTGLVQSFLAELDGFSRKSDDRFVLFMAATNVPWEVDNAILNRFEKRILIPLPDRQARKGILRIHLEKKGYSFEGDLGKIADLTQGYSGRDIRNLCKDVSIRMIREMNPAISEMADSVKKAKGYHLRTRTITLEDFRNTFERFKPTTSDEVLRNVDEWRRKFGSE